jgi:hypothetical protein
MGLPANAYLANLQGRGVKGRTGYFHFDPFPTSKNLLPGAVFEDFHRRFSSLRRFAGLA